MILGHKKPIQKIWKNSVFGLSRSFFSLDLLSLHTFTIPSHFKKGEKTIFLNITSIDVISLLRMEMMNQFIYMLFQQSGSIFGENLLMVRLVNPGKFQTKIYFNVFFIMSVSGRIKSKHIIHLPMTGTKYLPNCQFVQEKLQYSRWMKII